MNPENRSLGVLARACLRSASSEEWGDFIRLLQPVLARVVYRVAAPRGVTNPAEIDDIVQDIFLKIGSGAQRILRVLPVDNDVSTWAFFKVMAANCARDYLRGKYADKRGNERTVSADSNLEELAGGDLSPVELQVLIHQVDAALAATPRERTIFWLYYREGLTAREIAAIPAFELTPKGVESSIYRLTAAVRKTLGENRRGAKEGNSAGKSS
jgi:RNA polymerase sigma-70 factor (ECF subfamily)